MAGLILDLPVEFLVNSPQENFFFQMSEETHHKFFERINVDNVMSILLLLLLLLLLLIVIIIIIIIIIIIHD